MGNECTKKLHRKYKDFFYLRSFDSKQLKTFLNVKSASNIKCVLPMDGKGKNKINIS